MFFLPLAINLILSPSWAAEDAPVEDVVVEGQREREATETNTSAALTVIPLDGSLPISGEVADALETATGVRIERLGGMAGWSTVSIRGASSRQVAVYMDGVPLNPDGATALNLSELPTTAFERIEVYRGNPPPQFGSAPMGGVVNLVTPQRPESMGFSATAADHSTHRVGAFGAKAVQVGSNAIDVWAAVESLGTEGNYEFFQNRSTVFNLFDDSFETRQNNDKNQINLLSRIRTRSRLGTFSVTGGMLKRAEGIPGPASAQSTGTRLDTTRFFTAVNGESDGSWGRSQLSAWLINTHELWDDRGNEVGVGVQHEDRDTRMLGMQTTTDVVVTPTTVAIVAGSVRHDQYTRFNRITETEDAPMERTVWSASPAIRGQLLDERLQLDGTVFVQGIHNDVFGDAALSQVSGAITQSTTDFIAAKPRAGVLVRLSPSTVTKASWGQYLRPPDFTELFGNRGSVIGNPSLLPESSTSADLGFRTTLDGPKVNLVCDIAGFRSDTRNKIVFIQNSQRTVRPINVKGARIQGVEAALTLGVFDAFQSRTSLSRSWTENLSEASAYAGNQLPGIPNVELSQRTMLSWTDSITVGHSYSLTNGEYWDQTNWYQSAPRHFHSAFARVVPWSTGPELEIETRNLTNQMVEKVERDPLNTEDDAMVLKGIDDFHGYPLPGQTWLLSLRWSA